MSECVAVLGAGAWGTALAAHLERTGRISKVHLWARDVRQAEVMRATRENAAYLPGTRLDARIEIFSDLSQAVAGAGMIVIATPVSAIAAVVGALVPDAGVPLFWVGKGFLESAQAPGVALVHSQIAPRWPAAVGVISGPSFAEEVARGLPTAVAVASTQREAGERLAAMLRGEAFRAYVSDDLIGIETGGAIKNVLAIAAGASDGLGFGNNARAALITRGLAETGRLSIALGGKRETLMGLAGLGDLVLTCTGDLSRNRRVGLALASGQSLEAILGSLRHVAEGVTASRAAHALATSLGVEMPICNAVYRVLHENLPARKAVEALLAREPGPEFH